MFWTRKTLRGLDSPLFGWPDGDEFSIRDLLNGGCLIVGRAGSGKTSSSGRASMHAIVSNPDSGGLIIAAKPEDVEDVQAIFRKVGRKDLVIFGPEMPWRFNFLNYLGTGEARNVVQCMMMIGESLQRGNNSGEDGDYWKAQCERLLETVVIALQSAGEPVTAERMHKFVMTAAQSPADLQNASWQQKYHASVLERGHCTRKSRDYQLAADYWISEFPGMADRTRSSILTYATQILHVFNSGMCREMVSGETNITPDAVLNGHWMLVNFPPSTFGTVGSFISTGVKYLTQLAILKRKATEASPFVTIWCDEAHQIVNSFDSSFIAMCRSHKGCLVYLTQSVSSFYAAMKGDSGRHQADALLANFSHVIVHPCDPMTAKWAGAKLGRRKEVMFSGSSSPSQMDTVWDQMFGQQHVTSSFSEHYEQVLQDQEFMIGRTGGPTNGYIADAILVKSGEPFRDGQNFKRVWFSQR